MMLVCALEAAFSKFMQLNVPFPQVFSHRKYKFTDAVSIFLLFLHHNQT